MTALCDESLDDISEMYGKLRRLVLEYLGIPSTPNKLQSSTDVQQRVPCSLDDAAARLVYVERRGQSAPPPTRRSWSRPSITDMAELTTSNVPAAVHAKSPPSARGSVVSLLYLLYSALEMCMGTTRDPMGFPWE